MLLDWLKKTYTLCIFGPAGKTTVRMKVWKWSRPNVISTEFEKLQLKGGTISAVCIDEIRTPEA